MAENDSEHVSVIIPCYKHAHFLPDTIESVLRQTYLHIDIIVVDDGSPDNVAEVVARYPTARCLRQPNLGLSAARNAGFRASRGKYVVFLDADDRLLPTALATSIAFLREHPELGFVCGHRTHIDLSGAPLPTNLRPCVDSDHYVELLKRNYIGPPAAVMYPRNVIEKVGGFQSDLKGAEDYDMSLRIAQLFPVLCHHHVIAEYRVDRTSPIHFHESQRETERHTVNSMSHNYAVMLKSTIAAVKGQRKHVRRNPEYTAAYHAGIRHGQEIYGEHLINELRAHIWAREWVPAMHDAGVVLRYYPRGFFIHALRKLYCVAFRVPRVENTGGQ